MVNKTRERGPQALRSRPPRGPKVTLSVVLGRATRACVIHNTGITCEGAAVSSDIFERQYRISKETDAVWRELRYAPRSKREPRGISRHMPPRWRGGGCATLVSYYH